MHVTYTCKHVHTLTLAHARSRRSSKNASPSARKRCEDVWRKATSRAERLARSRASMKLTKGRVAATVNVTVTAAQTEEQVGHRQRSEVGHRQMPQSWDAG